MPEDLTRCYIFLSCPISFVINILKTPNILSCFQDEIARVTVLEPDVEHLHEQLQDLREKEETPMVFDADIAAFQERYQKILAELRAREKQLVLGE